MSEHPADYDALTGLLDEAAAALNVALHAARGEVALSADELTGCEDVLSRIATEDGWAASVLPPATCSHGEPEDECPSCAACAACRGECGVCPYVIPPADGREVRP